MAELLYNGVRMPDMDTVWTDKTTYPYAYVQQIGPQYYLSIVSTQFYVNAAGTFMYWSADGAGKVYTVNFDSVTGDVDEWVFYREFTYSKDGWNTGPAALPYIWTNFDVYYSDGTLCFAGSEPESLPGPEPAYDRAKFLSGLAAGLAGKGEPTFSAVDDFGRGYIAGAALRKSRTARGA